MSTHSDPDTDALIERLAGRGDTHAAKHLLRDALLAEAAAVAEAEQLATQPLTADERARIERIRQQLEAANVLGRSSPSSTDTRQKNSPADRPGHSRRRSGAGVLAWPSLRWLLLGGATLAAFWWFVQNPQHGQPQVPDVYLRGGAEVTLIDAKPDVRAKALEQELQRLGWRALAIQVDDNVWWVSIPLRQEASDAQTAAARKLLNLKSGVPLPERVRVQP
jgi:hypothetical protein